MATTYTHIADNKSRTFLLIGFFVAFIIALGYVLSKSFNVYWLFPLAIAIAGTQALVSYWWSDKIALAVSGAQLIEKKDSPELFRVVENLSISSGLPMPRVYIINDVSPNAFATGRDPEHSAIAVTSGLLEKLDKVQLEGVIAHEFSHVGNYDILLQTALVVMVGVIVMISDWFLRISFGNAMDSDSSDSQANIYFMAAGIVLALLSPFFATILQLAISRDREYLADASGALLTRNPEGLATALEVISQDKNPLRLANKATAHMFISDPMSDHKDSARGLFAGLFSTHPDVAERIRRLREMSL